MPALGTVIVPGSPAKVTPLVISPVSANAGPSPSVLKGLNASVVLLEPAVVTVELANTPLVISVMTTDVPFTMPIVWPRVEVSILSTSSAATVMILWCVVSVGSIAKSAHGDAV